MRRRPLPARNRRFEIISELKLATKLAQDLVLSEILRQ
jgi:hypothetical protein